MKITATTTDEQIQGATKQQLIEALFTGRTAVLRSHRMRTWTKAEAVAQATKERDRLFQPHLPPSLRNGKHAPEGGIEQLVDETAAEVKGRKALAATGVFSPAELPRRSAEANRVRDEARRLEAEAAETANEAEALIGRVASTKIVKSDGEFIVRAFNAVGERIPQADYFTSDRADAEATAEAMVKPTKPTKPAATEERRPAFERVRDLACGLLPSERRALVAVLRRTLA